MATPILIDLSNFDTYLVESTQGRSGVPDGNIYFDLVNGLVEFIPLQELAQVDLGSGLEPNPLDSVLGIRLEGFYAFEVLRRRLNETLRGHDQFIEGNFKFAGAYNFINSRKPAIQADISIIRGSGWTEYARDGEVDRIYFGAKGLSNIEPTSQPYHQLVSGGAPTDFAKIGNINESVQVYGSTVNVPADVGAGDFDTRTYMAVNIRTFGQNYDKKETTTDLSISELGGYSTGFALDESEHLTTKNYTLSDVYGVAQIAPWTGMSLEELDVPVTITGFNEVDGVFTWVVNNTSNGSLDEVVAYLDSLAQTDDDINAHATNVTNGKRVGLWYSYDATGRVVFSSGADSLGLYVYNIPTADQQKAVFADDSGNIKTAPFTVAIETNVGSIAKADALAWYHCFFATYFNSVSPPAVTVLDSNDVAIKGLASSANASNLILTSFDFDGDILGGPAGTNKDCVFLCEGDGGAKQAKTLFTITRDVTISFACAPDLETNL